MSAPKTHAPVINQPKITPNPIQEQLSRCEALRMTFNTLTSMANELESQQSGIIDRIDLEHAAKIVFERFCKEKALLPQPQHDQYVKHPQFVWVKPKTWVATPNPPKVEGVLNRHAC